MAEDRPVSTVTSAVNSEYATPPPSMPGLDSAPLEPPRVSFFGPGPSIGENSPRDSRVESATGQETDKEGFTPGHSTTLLPVGKPEDSEAPFSFSQPVSRDNRPFYRRPAGLAIALGALVAVILAIALPASLIHKSKHGQSNSSNNPGNGNGTGSGNGNPTSPKNSSSAITGGDGSTIVSGNTTFVYSNPFGGYCEFFSLPQCSYVLWAPDGRHMMFAFDGSCVLSCGRACVPRASWFLRGPAMGFRRAFLGRCKRERPALPH
jgi:hypothetical protein